MTDEDVAVREERVLPVASRSAGTKQALFDDPIAAFAQEVAEAFDARDATAAECALEDDASVVLARSARLELAMTRDARPFAEQIDVARVVHLIDDVRAARTAADLAEDRFALRREEPLHVREAIAHAERG